MATRTYEPWSNDRLDTLLQDKGNKVTRLGEVDRYRDKVLVRCNECNHEWMASPQTLENSGCPECYQTARVGARKRAKYTMNDVVNILQKGGYNLKEGEKYQNNNTPISMIHKETGEEKTISFRSFLQVLNKKK